jgi:large subunit ribosomal protein L19e
MNLGNQRKLSAELMNVGESKVWFDNDQLEAIKAAITRDDLRKLINKGIIGCRPELGTSRIRARKRLVQRRKGRQAGPGTRKGSSAARLPKKEAWMLTVRSQRSFIKELKEKELVEGKTYRNLYLKIKGGYFRNRRHIKLYLEENKLFKEKKK